METIYYKDYVGSVEQDNENPCYFGSVLGIRSLISYEGSTKEALFEDFKGAIDDYLTTCEVEHIAPEKSHLN